MHLYSSLSMQQFMHVTPHISPHPISSHLISLDLISLIHSRVCCQIQIPADPPPSIFTTVEDGPGWAILMYYRVTEVTEWKTDWCNVWKTELLTKWYTDTLTDALAD